MYAPFGWRPTALRTRRSAYRSVGYREVGAFNDEAYARHWFEKTLDDAPTD